jgi:hypothetical protein
MEEPASGVGFFDSVLGRTVTTIGLFYPAEVHNDTSLSNKAENYWTCYLKLAPDENASPSGPSQTSVGVGGNVVLPAPTTRCVDLRRNESRGGTSARTEVEAQQTCSRICENQTSLGNKAYDCQFIRTLGCKDDTTLDIKDDNNMANQLILQGSISELRSEVGNLANLSKFQSVQNAIGSLVTAAVGVLGSVAFAFYTYAGVVWMTARGNSEKTEQATKILVWTTLGICLVLGSYVLADFVIQGFIL